MQGIFAHPDGRAEILGGNRLTEKSSKKRLRSIHHVLASRVGPVKPFCRDGLRHGAQAIRVRDRWLLRLFAGRLRQK
jgi:hypothetical protein